MATKQKCAHKGCGKMFTDLNEDCIYHPGPPEFHEGQKGWKCCKPRVLTFDEFLEIPPCTTGKHSTIDENAEAAAAEAKAKKAEQDWKDSAERQEEVKRKPITQPIKDVTSTTRSTAMATPTDKSAISTPSNEMEEDSDDPDTPLPTNTTCRRRACGKSSNDFLKSADTANNGSSASDAAKLAAREDDCVFHPGAPIFHEGSKGWTCCKRRVLEFDEFMKIQGCKTRKGHCFVGKRSNNKKKMLVGSGKTDKTSNTNGTLTESGPDGTDKSSKKDTTSQNEDDDEEYEILPQVRNDFYQTPNKLIVSFYLKKIDKSKAVINFNPDTSSSPSSSAAISLSLPTTDGKKYTERNLETWAEIDAEKCEYKIMGTKLELTIVKSEGGVGWPVLRKSDRDTGERIQVGRAGKA